MFSFHNKGDLGPVQTAQYFAIGAFRDRIALVLFLLLLDTLRNRRAMHKYHVHDVSPLCYPRSMIYFLRACSNFERVHAWMGRVRC